MAYQDQFYTVGTVTVTNGSASVSGAGTGWETALIVGGVFYAGGGAYPIHSVSSETELTLAIPYTGVDATGTVYAIDRQRAAAISNIAMNDRLAQIIREIGVGNIEDLNALDLIANQIIRTDAAGKLTQSDITAAALVLLKLAGTAAADQMPYFTGANGADLTALSAFARTILDDTTGAAMWATMGGTGSGSAIKFPNGVMLQRGASALPSVGYGTIPFPTAFPTACYGVVASISENAGAAYTYTITAGSVTRASFYGTGHTLQPGSLVLAPVSFQWIAWGN